MPRAGRDNEQDGTPDYDPEATLAHLLAQWFAGRIDLEPIGDGPIKLEDLEKEEDQ